MTALHARVAENQCGYVLMKFLEGVLWCGIGRC